MTRSRLATALVVAVVLTSVVGLSVAGTAAFSGADQPDQTSDQPDQDQPADASPMDLGDDAVETADWQAASTLDDHEEFREVPMDVGATDEAGDEQPELDDDQPELDETQPELDETIAAGVDEGIELVESQGGEVTDEEREAAIEGALDAATILDEAEPDQVRAAAKGSTHGTLVAEQRVNVTQLQAVVSGATEGSLLQHQTANVTQIQSASWGASHGAIAQKQHVTVEQLQVASFGAAAGSAFEAGEKEVGKIGKIQEAAQGSAYGALSQIGRKASWHWRRWR